jgi:hypothetical protein
MGILFQTHSMNLPNDDRIKEVAIYRDDMIAQLSHGDDIITTASVNNVWKYDETISLNSITYWKGKKVFDYNLFVQPPLISYPTVSKENSSFRFEIFYSDVKFAQFVVPTDAIKRFYHMPINLEEKAFSVIQLASQEPLVVDEVLNIKLLTDQVLKHGKDGDGDVFLPYVGMNGYVDFNFKINEPSKRLSNRPFLLKSRVFVKSLPNINDRDDIINQALFAYRFYLNDVIKEVSRFYSYL